MPWDTPDKIMLGFKIVETKYADDFIKKGSIKLSTPNDWLGEKNEAIKDYYEGSYYVIEDSLFWAYVKIIMNEYPLEKGFYVISSPDKQFHIKNQKTMNLPCFCFYGISVKDLPEPKKEGKYNEEIKIATDYFKKMIIDAEKKDGKKRKAIFISNPTIFFDRLKKYLYRCGINDESCFISNEIVYCDKKEFKGIALAPDNYISPLMRKQRDGYDYQHERRLIINSSNEKVLNILRKPISIGNLSDICQIIDEDNPLFEIKIDASVIKK